jgi:hypothetical protein
MNKRTLKKITNIKPSNSKIQKENSFFGNGYIDFDKVYKKLANSLLEKSVTKYILAGVGLAILAPILKEKMKKSQSVDSIVNTFNDLSKSWKGILKTKTNQDISKNAVL